MSFLVLTTQPEVNDSPNSELHTKCRQKCPKRSHLFFDGKSSKGRGRSSGAFPPFSWPLSPSNTKAEAVALMISAKSRQGPKPPRKRFPSGPTSVKEIPMVYILSQPSVSEGRCNCVSVWRQRNDNPSCLSHMIRGEGSLKASKCQGTCKEKGA